MEHMGDAEVEAKATVDANVGGNASEDISFEPDATELTVEEVLSCPRRSVETLFFTVSIKVKSPKSQVLPCRP